MELPSNIVSFLRNIHENPDILVAFAAFHPFVLLILFLPLGLLLKLVNYKPKEQLSQSTLAIIAIFSIGWIMGFVSQILMLFMMIPGLKMLIIYLAMYLCITAFVFSNYRGIVKLMREKMDERK